MTTRDDEVEKEDGAGLSPESEMAGAVERAFHSGQVPAAEDIATGEHTENAAFVIEEILAVPISGSFWAKLLVNWRYPSTGEWFHCDVTKYQASNNGGRKGNIWFGICAAGEQPQLRELTQSAIQDGGWHDIEVTERLRANTKDVEVHFTYIYDRENTSDPELRGIMRKAYKPDPPNLDPVEYVSYPTFDLSGSSAVERARITIRNGIGTVIGGADVAGNRWTTRLGFISDLTIMEISIQQRYADVDSEKVGPVILYPASVTLPTADSTVPAEKIVFKGLGKPREVVKVVDHLNNQVLGTVSVPSSGKWEIPVSAVLPTKRLLIKAGFPSGFFTDVVSFTVLGAPIFSDSQPEQEQTFVLRGTNSLNGARLVVWRDLTGSVVVVGDVTEENGDWDVQLGDLPPGPISLVLSQSFGGQISSFSAPRAFRIRPPVLKEPEVAFLGTTVKFSGIGHFDEKLKTEIHFTIDDGPAPVPPPANVEVMPDGTWQTTAQAWPLGTYKITVIQKIADRAGAWIDSHACQFEVKHWLSQVTEVTHTPTYRPVFSGKGYTGATVRFTHPDGWEMAPATLVVNGRWSSATHAELGPTKDQKIGIHQSLPNVDSPEPLEYVFSIPPQAPGVNDPQENGQSPIFTGTCWPGAHVVLAFNGEGRFLATTNGDGWRYEKPGGFDPGDYTVTVIQIAAEQDSVAVKKDFTVKLSMLTPQIDTPQEGAEVGADLVVTGRNGMAGASMQLRDAQYGNNLAQEHLTADGPWSITLTDLLLRRYTIDAQQTLNGQKSEPSDPRGFEVVVLAPQITVPEQDCTMPRDGKFQGTGWHGAYVEIWDVDADVQLASNIEVQPDGSWYWELKQSIGHHQIWARQTFGGICSRESPIHNYSVVPNAPSIETPTADDHVGRRVWVCGFGVPGDNVLVTLGDAQGEAPVADDRTWSVLLSLSVAGSSHTLQVIACSGEFQSDPTVQRVAVGTYLPVIQVPQPGRRVDRDVYFRGYGRPGAGQLVSWFNPEVVWLEQVPVSDGQWQGQSGRTLPGGSNWCWFHQTLTDVEGETVSERVLSSRFEVDVDDAPAIGRG